MDISDHVTRETQQVIAAMQREIRAYTKLRNSIWFGVKINGMIGLIIVAVTLLNALIMYRGLP